MIPPSLPGAAEAAVSVQDASPSPFDFLDATTTVADDFSSFISQALDAFPANSAMQDQPPPSPTTAVDSPAASPFDDANSNYLSSSGADASPSSSSTDSTDDDAKKISSRKQSTDAMDPAVQNNIAMLLAGAAFPATRIEHFVPAPALNQGGGNGSNVQALNSDGEARSSARTAREPQTPSSSPAADPVGKTPAIASPNLAEQLKSFNEAAPTAKDSPTTAAASPTPAPTVSETANASTQAALLQAIASMEQDGNPAAASTGTTAALNAGTMKSTGQKTENAGRTVQKLPSTSASGNASSGSNGPSVPIGTTGSGRKSDWGTFSGSFDLAIPMATGELHDSASAGAAPAPGSSAAQAERVANFVSQEALTIRLSGATSLAVSLKLDHQTELFVQLTSHAGQIQASLRCERGNLDGLEGHWTQLQESLARQNIELLPPDNRSFSQNQSGNHSNMSGAGDSDQTAQKQRQSDTTAPASASANQPANTTGTSKTQRKNSRQKGWESWA